MKAVVDRIEGEFAVCEAEDGTMFDLKLILISNIVTDGTVLNIEDGKITVDIESTEIQKKAAKKLLDDIF